MLSPFFSGGVMHVTANPAPASAAAPRAAVWEDFIDIFYAPSQVFARRAMGSVWIPLCFVTVAMTALVYVNSGVLEPMMSAEFTRGMAATIRNTPSLTPEALDRFRQIGLRVAQFGGVFTVFAILFTGA